MEIIRRIRRRDMRAVTRYCFIKPDCVDWVCCDSDLFREAAPCAPSCSPHPKSNNRVISDWLVLRELRD